MKHTFSTVAFLLFFSTLSFSQTDSAKKRITRGDITTQGDQEKYWGQEIFDNNYEQQHFGVYKGEITCLSDNIFRYDNNIIAGDFTEAEFRIVFERGIIYPSIFTGYSDGRVLEKAIVPDSLKETLLYKLTRDDSMRVVILNELDFLNPSVKVRRYTLYLWRPGRANPSMYVMELTNESATNVTNLKGFLKEAKLSFLKFVSILI